MEVEAGLEMVPLVAGAVGGNGGELTQNSNINVTIDDLAEGLIVVSFSHSDNLYQGVLFQLNRERGIPSGISFAKEHASHEGKCDNDPSQVTPLYQRHSYNQGNGGSGGAFNGIAHYHNNSVVSQPSLRRIIKPPARFKNARMSLRLRARPVLCAKCRSLCEDKADNNSGGGSSKEEETSTTENHKVQKKHVTHRVKLSTGKSQESRTSPTTTIKMNGKLRGNEPRQTCSVVDPQDLRYESVGSTGVVENYWRRPLPQPLVPSTDETYARPRKNKGSSSSTTMESTRKKLKTGGNNGNATSPTTTTPIIITTTTTVSVPPLPEKLVGAKLPATNSSTTFLLKSANVCDNNFPNTRSRKALNLKMCISKIAEMKKGGRGGSAKRKGGARIATRNMVDIRSKPLATVIKLKDHASPSNTFPVTPLLLQNHSDSSLESTEDKDSGNNGLSDECVGGGGGGDDTVVKGACVKKTRQSTKKSKDWENRIRTKSTVPVRYRDESYLTKNIFNFNKRRPPLNSSSSSSSSGGGEIPVLTISRSDDENTFKVTKLGEPNLTTDSTVSTSKIEDSCYDDNGEEDEDTVLTNNAVGLTSSSSSTSPIEQRTAANMEEEVEVGPSSLSQSPCSSSTLAEVPLALPQQISFRTATTTCSKHATTELIKTPTIKITFGSSGNGMVVQIPPKVALGSSVESSESTSTTQMKAARKAMKKARKEAKRRRSISPYELSPSSNALSPTPSGHPAYPTPSTKSASNLNNSISPISIGTSSIEASSLAVVTDKKKTVDPFMKEEHNLLFEDYSCNNDEPSARLPKKKKKQKKRRRSSKALKENDSFSTASSSSSSAGSHSHVVEPTVGITITSPHSTFEGGSPTHNNSSTNNQADSSTSFLSTVSDPIQQRQSFPSTTSQPPAPKRRRSMPATSTTSSSSTEPPRVCINLKRIDTNAYVQLPSVHSLSSSHSDNDDPSLLEESTGNNGLEKDDGIDLNEFPINNEDDKESPQGDETDVMMTSEGESVDYYKDKETECCYRKGDIVWGKLPACPWWPGKIDDILTSNDEETRAKVSWYKSTTQSCIQFKMLVPFQEYFDSKYARSRRRGLYQHAVKDALVEAHKLKPQDLSYD